MKYTIRLLTVVALFISFSGCAAVRTMSSNPSTVDPVLKDSSIGKVGTDLNTLATNAFADYASHKAGGSNWLFGISSMLFKYAPLIASGQADVKTLIAQWDGTTGQKLPDRIVDLFGASTGSSLDRANVLANAALRTAQNVSSNGQP